MAVLEVEENKEQGNEDPKSVVDRLEERLFLIRIFIRPICMHRKSVSASFESSSC